MSKRTKDMEFERESKVRKLMEPELNLLDLPSEMLEHVATFISRKHLKNFGLASKECQQIVRMTKKKYLGLKKCVDLREMKRSNKVLSKSYISLNLNECHWMSSTMILQLISKGVVRKLKLIDCACTPEVIEAVSKLNFNSLTISLTKNWRNFFIDNELNSIPCFKSLKKLKVFHPKDDRSGLLVNHVSRYVLRHCLNLEYLKLFTHPVLLRRTSNCDLKSYPALTVPKLKTLILDFHDQTFALSEVKNFLRMILKNEETPLKQIYLGNLTPDIILSGFFRDKNYLFENTSTFYLGHDRLHAFANFSNLLKVDGYESIMESMLKSPNCKKISLKNMEVDNLAQLMETIVKSGNTSIEEINLRSTIFGEYLPDFISAISDINFQITFLDIRIRYQNYRECPNSALINAISNLTNLHTLYVDPLVFSSKTGAQENKMKSSIRNLAKNCKFLRNLRIVDTTSHMTVSENVLSCIKFFKNLRELHLVNFQTFGEKIALPEITEKCSQLKYLYIKSVHKLHARGLYTSQVLKHSLVHAKRLKHLSLFRNFKLTKGFVDVLSKCTELEKLCFELNYNKQQNKIKYFANSLKNLTQLEVFITRGPPHVLQQFRTAFDEIEGRRKPSFYGNSCDVERDVPVAHLHMLQYMTAMYTSWDNIEEALFNLLV